MKPIVGVAGGVLLLAAGWHLLRGPGALVNALQGEATTVVAVREGTGDAAWQAFEQRARGRMLKVTGTVQRLLADDLQGSPHQRFIIVTDRGQSLLVAHNIALAPRLDGLAVDDVVSLYGEYEWNDQGGVMHWTHDDPDGSHVSGYIDWKGRRFQ